VDIIGAVLDVGVAHQGAEKRQRGIDTLDDELIEGAAQPHQGFIAIAAVDDQLADQRVIIWGDPISRIDGAIDPDPQTAGRMIVDYLTRRRPKTCRMFGIYPALDRMALEDDVFLGKTQRCAGGNLDLLIDEINTGNHFRDRMLDLNTRIHLNKVELVVFIQKFYRAGPRVVQVSHRLGTDLADCRGSFRGMDGREAFLPHFLVPALQRAITFAKMNGLALSVTENLDLNMARLLEVFFEIDSVIPKSGLCFKTGTRNRRAEIVD
jgi:hypothetical protein